MKYILDRTYAGKLLEWAYEQNHGPWYEHSLNVAKALKKIVLELVNKGYQLDINLAYNAALLHDIGRYKCFTKSVIHLMNISFLRLENGAGTKMF
ncbi:hypothetical protein BACCIP111883_02821 [Sutcliffiella rhizosphaerae]|uniref:HD domain-containing protein n=1 Tax=Sutcliffiella rhizosphaerae TaxID=2880967 RepID=A0ABN8AGP3_9BACI|nr:hypothetical protein BACCIP111883_02821 [Sutcliffiella rhizosphaerae]